MPGTGLGTCPQCGGTDVWRSSGRVRHLLRTVLNKGHRFCASCGEKWHVHSFVHGPEGGLSRTTVFLVGSFLLGIVTVAVISTMTGWNPIRWAKTQVRSAADSEHGRESKSFLWEVLGGCYESKEDAKSDYHEHSKD